jgi:hypothetical protein
MNKEEFKAKSCAVPLLTLSTFSNGNYHPCCWIDQPYKKEDGTNFDFNVDTPEAAWQSPHASKVKQIFMTKGAIYKECQDVCFAAESCGGTSKRQALLKYMFKDETTIDEILEKEIEFPRLLEVKLTNLCNLRCKTCIPEHSSSIMAKFEPKTAEDNKRIILIKKSFDLYLESRGSVFLDSIIKNIEAVEWLEFYGGEPFMIKDHKKFLRQIIDSGYAKNIVLSYTTNGTKYDADYIEIFKEFKGVIISLSIDAIGELNDEIREGSKWEEIETNLRKYIALKEAGSITGLNINSTISMFNVFAIFDLVCYFNKIDCTLSLSVLEHPQEMSIVNLSAAEKERWIINHDAFLTFANAYGHSADFHPQLLTIRNKILS